MSSSASYDLKNKPKEGICASTPRIFLVGGQKAKSEVLVRKLWKHYENKGALSCPFGKKPPIHFGVPTYYRVRF